jgi:hypothetical protein
MADDHGVLHHHRGTHGLRCPKVAATARKNWGKYKTMFKLNIGVAAGIEVAPAAVSLSCVHCAGCCRRRRTRSI